MKTINSTYEYSTYKHISKNKRVHPTSSPMGTGGSFPWVKAAGV
jgi:hypothetical protein